MEKRLSRRGFIKKTARAVTAAAVLDLSMIVGSRESEALTALAAERSGEDWMSHVSVKLWPGRSEQALQHLAQAITEDVVKIIGGQESSVSVAIEEISSSDWKEEVYDPEIRGKALYKKPGYSM